MKLPASVRKGYNVYFERAFELFREEHHDFLPDALQYLTANGLVITDAGLKSPLQEKFARLETTEDIRPLGFYKNLSLYLNTAR